MDISKSFYFTMLPKNILEKKIEKDEFPFSKYLFWDADIGNIEIDKHSFYIIERVITRGSLQDLYFLINIYTEETIRDAIIKSKTLDSKTRNFCSYYFKIPIDKIDDSSYYG
jgi:hypothetical protein